MVVSFLNRITRSRNIICCLLCYLVQGSLLAHPGIGLVYDGDRTIYYTDLNHVWQLDTESGESRIYVENVHTHELALDEEGNLYGEHYWYEGSKEQFWNYIWVKHTDGTFVKVRDNKKGENTDFSFVRDANFQGYSLRANNGQFELIITDSTSQKVWHILDLNRPGWAYVAQNKSFLFSDYPKLYRVDPERITVLATDLSSSRFPYSLQDKTHHIYGIWEDAKGTPHVALYGGRQVLRLNSTGTWERALRTGILWSPVNGVFDKYDNLWLMEARLDGVVRLRKIEMNQLGVDTSFSGDIVVLFLGLLIILGSILLFIRKVKNKNRYFNSSK